MYKITLYKKRIFCINVCLIDCRVSQPHLHRDVEPRTSPNDMDYDSLDGSSSPREQRPSLTTSERYTHTNSSPQHQRRVSAPPEVPPKPQRKTSAQQNLQPPSDASRRLVNSPPVYPPPNINRHANQDNQCIEVTSSVPPPIPKRTTSKEHLYHTASKEHLYHTASKEHLYHTASKEHLYHTAPKEHLYHTLEYSGSQGDYSQIDRDAVNSPTTSRVDSRTGSHKGSYTGSVTGSRTGSRAGSHRGSQVMVNIGGSSNNVNHDRVETESPSFMARKIKELFDDPRYAMVIVERNIDEDDDEDDEVEEGLTGRREMSRSTPSLAATGLTGREGTDRRSLRLNHKVVASKGRLIYN